MAFTYIPYIQYSLYKYLSILISLISHTNSIFNIQVRFYIDLSPDIVKACASWIRRARTACSLGSTADQDPRLMIMRRTRRSHGKSAFQRHRVLGTSEYSEIALDQLTKIYNYNMPRIIPTKVIPLIAISNSKIQIRAHFIESESKRKMQKYFLHLALAFKIKTKLFCL